ncbi:MAG TPA: HAD family hydrolase [Candidatus Kapabacteria bacterium]|nr:HAD family hydrolase [Candidatus Kapabacteria bacterium]
MKYLIWDFDGTLGYRTEGWTPVLTRLVQQAIVGSPITVEQLRPYLSKGFPWHDYMTPHTQIHSAEEWWNMIEPLFVNGLLQCGVNDELARTFAGQIRHIYPKTEYWSLYDDVIPALQNLSAKGWTHILLSNHIPELSLILAHLQVDRHFVRIFNSAETGYEKPHPQAYKNVIGFIGSGATAWMIGDNINADVRGAEAAGLPAILVRKENTDAKYFSLDVAGVARIVE